MPKTSSNNIIQHNFECRMPLQCPCSDFMDMLWRLINCRIIIIIIIITITKCGNYSLPSLQCR